MDENENITIESLPENEENLNMSTINMYMKAILSESKQNSSALSVLSKKYVNLEKELRKRKREDLSDSEDGIGTNTTRTVYLNNPNRKLKASKNSSLVKNPNFHKTLRNGSLRKDNHEDILVAEPMNFDIVNEIPTAVTVSQREVTPIREDLAAEPDALIFDLNAALSDSEDIIPLNQMAIPAIDEGNFEQILRPVSPVSSVMSRSGNMPAARPASIGNTVPVPDIVDGNFSSDTCDIPILTVKQDHSWDAPKKSFEWFKRIADSELSDADLDNFMKDFIPPNDIAKHFEPPRLPNAIWNRIKAQSYSSDEFLKQRSIMKSQKFQSSAIMPLLSVLESLKPSDPNQRLVASAIQMLCSSNLQLTRLRRTSVAKFAQSVLRQPLFSQPVTHLHMFGADENESAEKVLKTQATSFSKVLNNPIPSKLKNFRPNQFSQESLHSSEISSRSYQAPAGSSKNYVLGNARPSASRYAVQPQPPMSGSKISNQSNSQQPFRASFRGRGRSSRYRAFRRTGSHQ